MTERARGKMARVVKDAVGELLPAAARRLGLENVVPLKPIRAMYTVKLKASRFSPSCSFLHRALSVQPSPGARACVEFRKKKKKKNTHTNNKTLAFYLELLCLLAPSIPRRSRQTDNAWGVVYPCPERCEEYVRSGLCSESTFKVHHINREPCPLESDSRTLVCAHGASCRPARAPLYTPQALCNHMKKTQGGMEGFCIGEDSKKEGRLAVSLFFARTPYQRRRIGA